MMKGFSASASTGAPLIRASTNNTKSVLLVPKRGNNSNRINSNRINSNRVPPTNDSNNNTPRQKSGNSRDGSGRKEVVGAVDSNSACGGGGSGIGAAGGNNNDSNSRRLMAGLSHDSGGGSTNVGIGGTISCWGGSDFVVISCKDSGAGLSKDNLSQLFKEGVQFKANELQGGGGSGLGLFITKGIVQHSLFV